RGGDRAASGRETVHSGRSIEVAPRRASADARSAIRWINDDVAHRAQIDDDPAVADRESRGVVAAAANGDRKFVLAAEANRRLHVTDGFTPRNQRGTTIDHSIPHFARGIELGTVGAKEIAAECLAEIAKAIVRKKRGRGGGSHWRVQ